MTDRRSFLKLTAAGGVALAAGCNRAEAKWVPADFARPARSRTAILPQSDYSHDLTANVLKGLELCGMDVRGKRVVLKPNLVEFDPDGVVNTNPLLIVAAIEAFRERGAREVIVAEGPGHRRDNEYLLEASGLEALLRDAGASYVDLNTDDVRAVPLRTRFTSLEQLYLPETVLGADLLVSMPKMKTHKWVGATLSMKNMFGIIPGSIYGWPKNILHWEGVTESIIDINAALQMPRFNIVDAVTGMEGNGPIQGTARHSGILVFGTDCVAVDATCARLMRLDPMAIDYVRESGAFLGNAEEHRIDQLAEPIASYAQPYQVLPQFEHIKLV